MTPPRGRKFDRVGEQIPGDLLQACSVGLDSKGVIIEGCPNLDTGVMRRLGDTIDRRPHDRIGIDGFNHQAHFAERDPGIVQKIRDHARLDA